MSKIFMLSKLMQLNILAVFAIMMIISGCTNEQVYHGIQAGQRNECETLQLSQREDCLKRLAPENYRDYKRERQTLEKK